MLESMEMSKKQKEYQALGINNKFKARILVSGGVQLAENEKRLFFIRHAEGEHNVIEHSDKYRGINPMIWCHEFLKADLIDIHEVNLVDPELTDHGRKQVEALRERTDQLDVQLVVSSPLTRTLETSLIAFESKTPIALEMLHEKAGKYSWDGRRCLSELKEKFPEVNFDMIEDEIDPLWTKERESKESLVSRAKECMHWIEKRSEIDIAVIGHGAIFMALFNAILDFGENIEATSKFKNAEMRAIAITF